MGPLVDPEGHFVTETSLTLRAGVDCGAGMRLLVFEQMLLLAKAPLALRAVEGPLTCVMPLVPNQVWLLAEALATFATVIRFLSCVSALVDIQ